MLDWTGERFVPWAKEAVVAYEHLHRYIWVSRLVEGKRVLDLASGEGYGANMLSRQAAFVCGVDIDEDAIRHASGKYGKPNLQFLKGSVTAVPLTEANTFDLITCFEAIEHIEQHDALLREVRRLLKPNGLFVVSTPNKEIYSAGEEPANPFHVKELTLEEFNALLTRYFSRVHYLGQRVHPASSMWPIENGVDRSVQAFAVERQGDEYKEVADEDRSPMYYVAVASDAGIEACRGSVLVDCSDELVNEKDRAAALLKADLAQREEALKWLDAKVVERDGAIQWLEGRTRELTEGLEWLRHCQQDLENEVASRNEALEWRGQQVQSLEDAARELSARVEATQRELALKREELEAIHQSRGWKLVLKFRAIRRRLAGK